MNKKYIILTGGDTGANNLGDQWILGGVKDFYKNYLDKYQIVIMMDGNLVNPDDGFVYIKDTKEEYDKLNIRVKDIKLLHYYGGGYLNEYWYDWKIWQYHYLVQSGLSPKKVVFTDQGIGPFEDSTKIKDLKKIAQKVKLFGLRDSNYLKTLKGSVFMFDKSVASINPPASIKKKVNILKKILNGPTKKIALNFRPGSASDYVGMEDKNYYFLLNTLIEFKKNAPENIKITFFPMLENQGLSEAKNLQKLLKTKTINGINITNRPDSYEALLKKIKKFDLVITSSYHAALAGVYSGVPVIGICNTNYYECKFSGLNKEIKSPFFQYCKISNFSSDLTSELLQKEPSLNERKYLQNTLLKLKKTNIKTWELIKEYI
jgi:polysaccharide pyruvyl transferase WcaK-like protein